MPRMDRSFGWIQNSANTAALKDVVRIFNPDTEINRLLREDKIPRLVEEEYGRKRFIAFLEQTDGIIIPYGDLKGKGVQKGYSRSNSPCSGIVQAAIHSQKEKEYTDDWSADCFIRWAVSLGFLEYLREKDSCRITGFGQEFIETIDNSANEKDILGKAYLSYPPAVRVLSLLEQSGHLTKFEIGRKLGFIGEAGFTSIPQNMYLQAYIESDTQAKRNEIRQDAEGSSDKYARMIAGWLCNMNWVKKVQKRVKELYAGREYEETIGQAYVITLEGKKQLKQAQGLSSKKKIPKLVHWEMLATKVKDKEYARNRRTLLLQYLNKKERSLSEILIYLEGKGYQETQSAILDDIHNFTNIGLTVEEIHGKYKISDIITGLSMPMLNIKANKSELTILKEEIREQLKVLSHKYLTLLDLSFDSKSNREFEIQTMDLFINELGFSGAHLGGTSKPDGVFYEGAIGVIVDTKAYSKGYSLPVSQADEMIRYIEENKSRGDINRNQWWKQFGIQPVQFQYLFVASFFTGGFADRLSYIEKRTKTSGGAMKASDLLLFAEALKSGQLTRKEFFTLLSLNQECVYNL